MEDRLPTAHLAALLLRLKRRLAPAGSRRERVARAVYAPMLRRWSHDGRIRRTPPAAHCVALPGTLLPPPARVLVLKLDHIGDFVVALPALQRLRAGLPAAEITLVCGSWNRALAEASGLADRVACFDALADRQRPPVASRAAFATLVGTLGDGFDCALDLRHDADTRPLLAAAPARLRAGFAAPGAALDLELPDLEHVAAPLAARTRLLLLVEALLDALAPPPHPALALAPADGDGPAYAVLAPGAGTPLKRWPPERMAALGTALAERHGLRLVLVGAPGEQAEGAALAAKLPQGRTADRTGRVELAAMPALLGGAALVVGMDSGLTHLAAALGRPTLCVMSGTASLPVWRPTGQAVTVLSGMAACSPCHYSEAAQCPHGVACLDAIGVADALSACEGLLAR